MIFLGFLITAAIPALMIFWGVWQRKNPPAYGCGKFSFRTKFARQDEERWGYSNTLFSHMITVTGINTGLVSVIFYFGVIYLAGGSQWAAASLCLLVIQAVCVLAVRRITNIIAKKTYPVPEEEDAEGEIEVQADPERDRHE